MSPIIGLVGAVFMAIGGAIGFEALNTLLYLQTTGPFGPTSHASDVLGFFAFLSIGIGLWLIALSARQDKIS